MTASESAPTKALRIALQHAADDAIAEEEIAVARKAEERTWRV